MIKIYTSLTKEEENDVKKRLILKGESVEEIVDDYTKSGFNREKIHSIVQYIFFQNEKIIRFTRCEDIYELGIRNNPRQMYDYDIARVLKVKRMRIINLYADKKTPEEIVKIMKNEFFYNSDIRLTVSIDGVRATIENLNKGFERYKVSPEKDFYASIETKVIEKNMSYEEIIEEAARKRIRVDSQRVKNIMEGLKVRKLLAKLMPKSEITKLTGRGNEVLNSILKSDKRLVSIINMKTQKIEQLIMAGYTQKEILNIMANTNEDGVKYTVCIEGIKVATKNLIKKMLSDGNTINMISAKLKMPHQEIIQTLEYDEVDKKDEIKGNAANQEYKNKKMPTKLGKDSPLPEKVEEPKSKKIVGGQVKTTTISNKRINAIRKKLQELTISNYTKNYAFTEPRPIDASIAHIVSDLSKIDLSVVSLYELSSPTAKTKARVSKYGKIGKEIIKDMSNIIDSTDRIYDLETLKRITSTNAFKILCLADKGNEFIFRTWNLDRKLSELKLKQLVEERGEYPKDIVDLAVAVVSGTISARSAINRLSGRNVQLTTYMIQKLSGEVSKTDVVNLCKNLGKIIESEGDAFDVVSRMCLHSNNDKALELAKAYKNNKNLKDKAEDLIKRAEENKKYSQISREITSLLADSSLAIDDRILDTIEGKIKEYNLDKSRIIIGRDIRGESISLQDIENYKEEI